MFFFVAPAVRPRMAPPAQETREEANTRIALQALRDLRPERQARGQLRTGWLVPKFCAIGQMAQALGHPAGGGHQASAARAGRPDLVQPGGTGPRRHAERLPGAVRAEDSGQAGGNSACQEGRRI